MTYPAVMFLEEALDVLKPLPADDVDLAHEIRQFRMLGEGRLQDARTSTGLISYTDIERGYLIGLETARVLLMQMPANYQDGKPIVDL